MPNTGEQTTEYEYLSRIKSPCDIKDLTQDELSVLTDEIRKYIIEKVKENRGHLASNLGVVELSLAEEMRTSPTIGPDGTIYCTGIKGGQPTLFCVKGSATGHANSWSQLGANPSKTGTLTVK